MTDGGRREGLTLTNAKSTDGGSTVASESAAAAGASVSTARTARSLLRLDGCRCWGRWTERWCFSLLLLLLLQEEGAGWAEVVPSRLTNCSVAAIAAACELHNRLRF